MEKIWNYNGDSIPYAFSRGGVKNINARVRRDGTLYVSAPFFCTERRIAAFLTAHADMLIPAVQARKQATEMARLPLQNGMRIPLFGVYRTLSIERGNTRAVQEIGNTLALICRPQDGDPECRATLSKYLARLAENEIESICRDIYNRFFVGMFSYPVIRFRRMVARWGSCCRQKGVLTFNTRLIYADRGAITYVVLHEFTHMLHPDHSSRFYAALATRMPDYKVHREALKQIDLARENWI